MLWTMDFKFDATVKDNIIRIHLPVPFATTFLLISGYFL